MAGTIKADRNTGRPRDKVWHPSMGKSGNTHDDAAEPAGARIGGGSPRTSTGKTTRTVPAKAYVNAEYVLYVIRRGVDKRERPQYRR
jgi:hypothetical protein